MLAFQYCLFSNHCKPSAFCCQNKYKKTEDQMVIEGFTLK
jgi:hypothetical protein